jgi:nicotinamidase-related amidase
MFTPRRHPTILRREDACLVVVDVQEPLLRAIQERDRLIAACDLLIRAATILGLPMLATQQNAARLGALAPEIAAALPPEREPLDKLCFSCCGSEPFLSTLRESGRSQVLLCGVEAHICVCQTALDLLESGFQVHVAADAISSRSERSYRIGLERMIRAGAVLNSAEMAVYELLREAGTPEFRQILQLVKSWA